MYTVCNSNDFEDNREVDEREDCGERSNPLEDGHVCFGKEAILLKTFIYILNFCLFLGNGHVCFGILKKSTTTLLRKFFNTLTMDRDFLIACKLSIRRAKISTKGGKVWIPSTYQRCQEIQWKPRPLNPSKDTDCFYLYFSFFFIISNVY